MVFDFFVYLYVYSEYFMLDGVVKINVMIQVVVDYDMLVIVVIDYGNIFVVFEFYKVVNVVGIKLIIGFEVYVIFGMYCSDKLCVQWGLFDQKSDDVFGFGVYIYMIMWSESIEGMYNLFWFSFLLSMEGYYFKLCMDCELLQMYGKGFIVIIGCFFGEIQMCLCLG